MYLCGKSYLRFAAIPDVRINSDPIRGDAMAIRFMFREISHVKAFFTVVDALVLLAAPVAQAQKYSQRTVRIVVPFPAGSAPDQTASASPAWASR